MSTASRDDATNTYRVLAVGRKAAAIFVFVDAAKNA